MDVAVPGMEAPVFCIILSVPATECRRKGQGCPALSHFGLYVSGLKDDRGLPHSGILLLGFTSTNSGNLHFNRI